MYKNIIFMYKRSSERKIMCFNNHKRLSRNKLLKSNVQALYEENFRAFLKSHRRFLTFGKT